MKAYQILEKYIKFFEERGHKRIENSSLVPLNDPSTLFTSSGMQPLVPYLLGEVHPSGKRLVNAQNSFRAQDIDEIGDNRHTTFFRMLGNWSLGDYFKKEQIPWFFEFLTKELQLDPHKLYVTVFEGYESIPEDNEAIEIWQEQFKNAGIDAKVGERILKYGVEKNWWSRSGPPSKMPIGEIGGPDTEVFYDFETEHDKSFGEKCHVNCDCGRYVEIGNSVFIQYKKTGENKLEELPNKNVDFGGGLERLVMVTENQPDLFSTELYADIIKMIEEHSKGSYSDHDQKASIRVIADHLKAAVYIIASGVIPSNKEQGYVLRRLLRRAAVKMFQLKGGLTPIPGFEAIGDEILRVEQDISQGVLDRERDRNAIFEVIREELNKFGNSLDRGLKILNNYTDEQLNALNAFSLFQSHGFPVEITQELFKQRGKSIDMNEYNEIYKRHRELSRTVSAKMFKGGLADHSEKTVMGHTATHLMHQALRDMFGVQLHQSGSNITSERVRFDFNFDRKLTPDELKKLEETVNQKITENLPVHFEMIETEKAKKMGAIGLFGDTYAKTSKIYFIGDEKSSTGTPKEAYSLEFCGGPHVNFTGEVKKFTIIKQESLGKGFQRIYAHVGD